MFISAFAFAAGVGVLYLWQIRVMKSDPRAPRSWMMSTGSGGPEAWP